MRYYWIRLKSSFLTSDKVDFLMSQKDGANYIVLYQMLCLKSINTDGVLAQTVGDLIIPYDCEKIARDCKYFPVDTVRVALELYKKLGMVYEEDDGVLKIADFDDLVGSAKADDHTRELWAERKRRQRLLEKKERDSHGTVTETITGHSHGDIEIEIEKEIEKEIDIDKENKKKDPKHVYGEYKHVRLTDTEYDRLINDFGYDMVSEFITKLDEYLQNNRSKHYSDHNLTIRNWIRRDGERKPVKKPAESMAEKWGLA